MSEEENEEMTYEDHELIEELDQNISTNLTNESENYSDEFKPKKRHKTLSELRHPRQKYCPRWQIEFPWLRPNRSDESIGYCNICKRELVCKKSHLERHQRSFKHMRLQGFENVFTVNEPEADLIEAHTSGYLDNSSNQDYHVEEMLDELDDEYTTIKVEPTRPSSTSTPVLLKASCTKKSQSKKRDIIKSEPVQSSSSQQKSYEKSSLDSHSNFKNMEYDRSGDYYYSMPSLPPPPKKDSFDLFFDSISATVKNLPPKLAAEVKSKVSQVIAEFELRAICEKEAQEKVQQSVVSIPTQVTNVVTIDPSMTTNSDHHSAEGVTHYVYAYQPKMQE